MIEGVEIKNLKVIKDDRGYLMEMLRNDDPLFDVFGQVYVSVCNPGVAKAWHYHKKQTDLFVIVRGNAKVVLYDLRDGSKTKGEIQEVLMGEKNPVLLKIPPLVVHGFTPVGKEPAYLVNCPNKVYDYKTPDEHRIPFNSKEINYNWGVERGG